MPQGNTLLCDLGRVFSLCGQLIGEFHGARVVRLMMRRPEVPAAPADAQLHGFLTRYRRAARHAAWGEIQAVLPSSVHGQAIADIVVADLVALVTLGACSQRVLQEMLRCFRRRVTINYAVLARWAHSTRQEVLWEFRSRHDLLVWEKQAEAIPSRNCGATRPKPHTTAP